MRRDCFFCWYIFLHDLHSKRRKNHILITTTLFLCWLFKWLVTVKHMEQSRLFHDKNFILKDHHHTRESTELSTVTVVPPFPSTVYSCYLPEAVSSTPYLHHYICRPSYRPLYVFYSRLSRVCLSLFIFVFYYGISVSLSPAVSNIFHLFYTLSAFSLSLVMLWSVCISASVCLCHLLIRKSITYYC